MTENFALWQGSMSLRKLSFLIISGPDWASGWVVSGLWEASLVLLGLISELQCWAVLWYWPGWLKYVEFLWIFVIYSSQYPDCRAWICKKLLCAGYFVLCVTALLTSDCCALAPSREFKSRQINSSIIWHRIMQPCSHSAATSAVTFVYTRHPSCLCSSFS